MKCSLKNREDIISKYLMNELSDEDSLKFEEHYFKCKVCFYELKAAEQALNLIAKEGKNAFQIKSQTNHKNFFNFLPSFSFTVKIGFASAAIALLFMLYFFFKNNSNENLNHQKTITQDQDEHKKTFDSSKTKDVKQTKEDDNLVAELSGAAFDQNPYYEEWINENVRSDNNVIEKVISPQNEKKFYDDVVFKWIMKEKVRILLSILKNSEEKIFSTKVNEEEFPEVVKTVTSKTFKKSGLYYWRIEDEKEILYLGKFYFLKRK